MTGLPQGFGVSRRKPAEQPEVPVEVLLWQQTLEDARRYQASAAWNSWGDRKLMATSRVAAEQYAYVRWLMGIDDYWLSLARTIQTRPEWQRLPHQVL